MGVNQSGRVTGREIKKNRDRTKTTRLLQVEVTAPEDIQTVEHLTQAGEDSSPPDNAQVIILDVGEAWKLAISSDDQIVPTVAPGEKKFYSTNQAGDTIKSYVYLKQDGTIEIANDEVTITITPGGDIQFTASGNLIGSATTMQLNGDGDNLTMWSVLNSSLQGLITALNNHTHGGGSNPDQTFSLDIDGAKADSLQTDG